MRIIQPRTLALLMMAGLILGACNTVKGAGRDIESVGRAGERVIN
jgi:predicted small secreted protein